MLSSVNTPGTAQIDTKIGPPPCLPSDLHWLGDREDADATRHAMDMRGCVLYFAQQSDCVNFMRWMTHARQSAPR